MPRRLGRLHGTAAWPGGLPRLHGPAASHSGLPRLPPMLRAQLSTGHSVRCRAVSLAMQIRDNAFTTCLDLPIKRQVHVDIAKICLHVSPKLDKLISSLIVMRRVIRTASDVYVNRSMRVHVNTSFVCNSHGMAWHQPTATAEHQPHLHNFSTTSPQLPHNFSTSSPHLQQLRNPAAPDF